ncbi:MAG: glycoside hydrolase family 52 protein [Candidatus Sumerlaeota bacterium]
MSHSNSFQNEHCPRGAAASFSIGRVGQGGGFSINSGKTAEQDLYIGYVREGVIHCLPYNKQGAAAVNTGMAEFIPTGDPEAEKFPPMDIAFIGEDRIERDFRLATERFKTDHVEFSLCTPVSGIPDPGTTPLSGFKESICPAIVGELVFDNADGTEPMQGFFAVGNLPGFRLLDELSGGEMAGLVTLENYGFATPNRENIRPFSDMFMDFAFRRPEPNRNFLTGIGGFIVDVGPGETARLPVAFAWYKPGVVTLGKDCEYAYTRHFANLTEVLVYALDKAADWRDEANKWDQWLLDSGLNASRRFLIAKAWRSYWGNSQLFVEGDRYRWVVNEGSCNMMNTLDLTVDMAYFERAAHPWLLRNVLDAFADEYRYRDQVKFHDSDRLYPGGVSFTHDHGYRDVFSRPHYSHYEAANHPACFSYMTHEELLNWILCAALYIEATEDRDWLHKRAGLIADCLESMQNRDHPEPEKRNGIMSLDSNRCGDSEEITTYDSLDPSLGQARNNSYMGVKCWAGYLAIGALLPMDDRFLWREKIQSARHSAELAANTLAEAFNQDLGFIPAILEGDDQSAIIPVIEGLIYPAELGLEECLRTDGPFGHLIEALKKHLEAVLVENKCRFADGGWKLSANNDNSWMSKIFICQHIAETILGFEQDEKADRAHESWWRVGCAGQSVVDQVVAGKSSGTGSTYPRTASSILWLKNRKVHSY